VLTWGYEKRERKILLLPHCPSHEEEQLEAFAMAGFRPRLQAWGQVLFAESRNPGPSAWFPVATKDFQNWCTSMKMMTTT